MSAFGVIVLAFLVLLAATIVVAIVLAPIGNSGVRQALSNLVSGVLTAPFYALVATVLYFRLRTAHGDDTTPAVAADVA
jgi:predicted membrane protein